MIIFLAYEGFELIANTAHDIKNPGKILPRAYFSAVIFVILLYILIAVVAFVWAVVLRHIWRAQWFDRFLNLPIKRSIQIIES